MKMPLETAALLKMPFIRFLHYSFINTKNHEAIAQLQADGNGFWTPHELLPDLPCYEDGTPQPSTIMEIILADLKRMSSMTSLHPDIEHYMFHEVVPMLRDYFGNHYPASTSTNHMTHLTSQIRTYLLDWATTKYMHLKDSESQNYLSSLLNVLASIKAEWDFNSDLVSKLTKPNDIMGHIDYGLEVYRMGWKAFCIGFSQTLGVKDLKRIIGNGMKNMATMLTQENVRMFRKGTEEEWEESDLSYREVVTRLVDLLRVNSSLMGPFLPVALRILRAVIFVEDPHAWTPETGFTVDRQYRDESWERFLNNRSPEKKAPHRETLSWVQNKYNTLGASVMALSLIDNDDHATKLAALRMANTMLENGNTNVQQTIYSYFVADKQSRLFVSLKNIIQQALDDVKEFKRLMKSKRQETEIHQSLVQARTMKGQSLKEQQSKEYASSVEDKLNIADISVMSETLKLLQNLCEGHHSHLQNLLREQSYNMHGSVDLFRELTEILRQLQPLLLDTLNSCDPTIVNLAIDLLSVLSEGVQGPCYPNQHALVMSDLPSIADRALGTFWFEASEEGEQLLTLAVDMGLSRSGVEREESEEMTINDLKSRFKTTIMLLLTSLLEGQTEGPVPKRLLELISITKLLDQLHQTWIFLRSDFTASAMNSDRRKDVLERELFQIFFFLQKLDDNDVGSAHLPSCEFAAGGCRKSARGPDHRLCIGHSVVKLEGGEIYDYLVETSSSVEIIRKGEVEKLYFRTPANCLRLAKNTKWIETTLDQLTDVPRENPHQKVKLFFEKVNGFSFEIDHLTSLSHNQYGWWCVDYARIVENMPFYLALLISLFTLFFYGERRQPWEDDGWAGTVVEVLGVLHLVSTFFWCLSFFIERGPIILHHQMAEMRQLKENQNKSTLIEPDITMEGSDFARVKVFHFNAKPWELPLPDVPEQVRDTTFTEMVMLLAKSSFLPYYLSFYIFGSVCGITFSKFFFCFHLLDFVRKPDGMMVIESIRSGGPRLIRTFVLAIIFMYIFSVCAFVVYAEDIGKCDTFFQCAISHIAGGVLDGSLENTYDRSHYIAVPTSIREDLTDHFRTIVELGFSVVWSLLLLNVFMGQMLDAFAEIRSAKMVRVTDSKERCFICNIDRFVFDNGATNGFREHIQDEHNPLFYLYFIQHLKQGNSVDFNGAENYVVELLNRHSHSFIPIGQALRLRIDGKAATKPGEELRRLEHSLTTQLEDFQTIFENEMRGLKKRFNSNNIADETDARRKSIYLKKDKPGVTASLDSLKDIVADERDETKEE
eukprot:GFYU01003448.1.p1 GENE.GFYU01003448.1~~GFYU01003448.1.p1  ORF type:complete len:1282 (-),score=390.67 GFYU01003448.1:91-3936(-)